MAGIEILIGRIYWNYCSVTTTDQWCSRFWPQGQISSAGSVPGLDQALCCPHLALCTRIMPHPALNAWWGSPWTQEKPHRPDDMVAGVERSCYRSEKRINDKVVIMNILAL